MAFVHGERGISQRVISYWWAFGRLRAIASLKDGLSSDGYPPRMSVILHCAETRGTEGVFRISFGDPFLLLEQKTNGKCSASLYDCSEEEKLFVKRLKLIKADIHAQLKACDCDISE